MIAAVLAAALAAGLAVEPAAPAAESTASFVEFAPLLSAEPAADLAARRALLAQLVEAGEAEAAIAFGRELADDAPFDGRVLVLLGRALLAVERAGEAQAVLADAARRRPDDPEVWKLLGYARFEAGDPAGAAEALRAAARIDPGAFRRDRDGSLALLFFSEMDATGPLVFGALALAVVLGSLILHELAHAGSAYLLGDPTPRALGRLTFNPLAHIDPIGTVVLPLLLVATRAGIVFGYARPVPFWPENFRRPRLDRVLTALAGPLSNVVLLLACLALGRLVTPVLAAHDLPLWPAHGLFLAALINAILACLNALPIFPLDGGHLVASLLPAAWGPRAEARLALLGILLILVVLESGLWDGAIEALQAIMTLAFGL